MTPSELSLRSARASAGRSPTWARSSAPARSRRSAWRGSTTALRQAGPGATPSSSYVSERWGRQAARLPQALRSADLDFLLDGLVVEGPLDLRVPLLGPVESGGRSAVHGL